MENQTKGKTRIGGLARLVAGAGLAALSILPISCAKERVKIESGPYAGQHFYPSSYEMKYIGQEGGGILIFKSEGKIYKIKANWYTIEGAENFNKRMEEERQKNPHSGNSIIIYGNNQ